MCFLVITSWWYSAHIVQLFVCLPQICLIVCSQIQRQLPIKPCSLQAKVTGTVQAVVELIGVHCGTLEALPRPQILSLCDMVGWNTSVLWQKNVPVFMIWKMETFHQKSSKLNCLMRDHSCKNKVLTDPHSVLWKVHPYCFHRKLRSHCHPGAENGSSQSVATFIKVVVLVSLWSSAVMEHSGMC